MKPINVAQVTLSEAEIEAAIAVLRSGALRQGPQCDAFEQAFAHAVGAKHALTCANGTAALHLAYLSFLQPGDEVLLPSFTFIATGSMVELSGGKAVLCDVDPETFLIDLADAERRVTSRTKAIVPVHLFGNPCDVAAVQAFARKHDLRIVWDAAQAHGAELHGKPIGGTPDFVTYSFYPTKNLFVGEGGMVCTEDDALAKTLDELRGHGQVGPYLHSRLGFNYRMTDIAGAIGVQQLERLPAMLERRRRSARLLNEAVASLPGLRAQQLTEGADSAWHQYCVVVDEAEFGCSRDALIGTLKAQGIGTAIHYPRGLHQQPAFEDLHGTQHLPVTEALAANILALPVHHQLEDADIQRVIEALRAARG